MKTTRKTKKKTLDKAKAIKAKIVIFDNYLDSLSEKKGKKNTKKTEIKKMHHPHHYSNANKEEIKYPTRNKTRQLEN